MLMYVCRRLAYLIVVLLIVSLLVFTLFYSGQSSSQVAANFCGRNCSEAALRATEVRLNLDASFWTQYWGYLSGLLKGDLGTDFQNGAPVRDLILDRLPVTLSIVGGAVVLWLLIGLSIGIQSALHPRSIRDRAATIFGLTFLSVPMFVLGLLTLLVFYNQLGWFPSGTYVPMKESPWGWAHHLILPWITLALIYAAMYARLMRGSLLDVLGQDYIRTAKANGLSRRAIIYRHGSRASLTPVVTQLGIDIGGLLGGAFITEQVFSMQGLGQLTLVSLRQGNLPVVAATVLLGAAFVLVASAVVDILYAVLDPRVRVS